MAKTAKIVKRILITPFQRFLATESSGGIILMFATALALIWANSPWGDIYETIWSQKLTVGYGDWALSKELILWVNDGLMAIFFFLVGLEIKRELLLGELSSFKKASLPFFAAIGGMVFPAVIFTALNHNQPGADGWGIPMATDIAFSLGILSLLGKRVPVSMKIFLTAFAIVDDLGAVMVIAIFYSGQILVSYLYIALALFLVLIIFNLLKLRKITPYVLVSVVIWYFFLKSGLHPTIAGIMAAFTIPITSRVRSSNFVDEIKHGLKAFKDTPDDPQEKLLTYKQLSSVESIRYSAHHVQSPLQKAEHDLHGFVAFFILPVFAIANAGVQLDDIGAAFSSALTINIALALIFGKTLGVALLSWVGVKLNLAGLPKGTEWKHLWALALLGGVGFTMALFIANLAFTDIELLNQAKAGILLGSTVSGIAGYFWLKSTLPKNTDLVA